MTFTSGIITFGSVAVLNQAHVLCIYTSPVASHLLCSSSLQQ